MEFCSPFDAAVAEVGPPAVFLADRHGALRLAANWTREAWERAPSARPGQQWVLCRDRDSGYVLLALCTGEGLLADHPRMDVLPFRTREEALSHRGTCGDPPIRRTPW